MFYKDTLPHKVVFLINKKYNSNMLSFEKEKLNMPDMYQDGISRGGDNTFAIFQRANGANEEYSYNYILEQSDILIKKIEKTGLKKGDRIAVVSSLRPWWYSLTYACLRYGLIMVCIDPGVPAIQLQNMMVETEVRAVFTTLKKIHLPQELEEHIPVFSIDANFPLMSKCDKIDVLLGKAKKINEETFFILFSSGTTSENRKAVLLRHSTVTQGIEYGMSKDAGIYKNTTAYTPRSCDLMLFPPYHIAGLLCATYDIYCNTKVIMLERLTPNALVSALNTHKPDNICTVPSMLTSLYKKIKVGYSKNIFTKIAINSLLNISSFFRKDLGINIGYSLLKSINKKAFGGNMKGFMIGASPIDEEVNKFFLDMGLDVSMAYGLTELGAPLAVTGKGYYPGTTGRVLRHTKELDIRIVNKDDTGRGEVEVKSPYRMISYINEKDNEGCFTNDGYFKTGDLGYFDKNNCLVICGRIKESIVLRNGEKLLPEEIESKYQDMDCVKEVCAFKIPGEGGCDDFAIALVKDKEKAIPDEPMKARVYERAAHLPKIYSPKEVYVVKEFPLSSSHKVQRFRLTEMAIKGNSEPITDSSMIPVDEDEITASLRKMLIEVGGAEWKSQKLTQGLLLNLDSLSLVNLFVAVQDKWDIDLFQSSVQPETFGELLDIVKNYDVIEKNNKTQIDYSKYPLPVSSFNALAASSLESLVKKAYAIKAVGLENIPEDTTFILCANHRTALDPAFVLSCLNKDLMKKTCAVGKAELLDSKVFSKLILYHNFIPIDRTGNSIKTLDRCRELLLENKNILIFPEGTNVENHTKVYPLKEGAAKLSIATSKPIIPVCIKGVAHVEKEMKNFKIPPFSGKITVEFGKPIYPENKDILEINTILAEKIDEMNI